jgi:hypothetical protein
MALSFGLRYRPAFRAMLGPLVKVLLAGGLFVPLFFLKLRIPFAAAVLVAAGAAYLALLVALRLLRPAELRDLWRKIKPEEEGDRLPSTGVDACR